MKQKNAFKIVGGVVHVDISTPRNPNSVMLIDPPDWNYLLSIDIGRIHCCQYKGKANRYARCRVGDQVKAIHRILFPDSIAVDHESGDGLNNKRSNIRPCTYLDNNKNKSIGSNNKSGALGVSWCGIRKRWRAYIYIDRAFINLGYFKDIKEATYARELAEIKYGFHENHGREASK